MKLKRFLLIGAAAGVVAALWPAAGGAATFRGIVVAREHGTLLVASPAGLVRAVHGRAAVGSRISVAAGRTRVVGRASKARIHGIVVRRIGTTLLLSSNRHLLALRAARVTATTAPAAPGTVVDAEVAIKNGELEEEDEDEVGQVAENAIAVQATIASVAAGSVTLNVQGKLVTVPLPAGLTLPATLVGQTVTIQLSLGDDEQGDDEQGDAGAESGGDD